MNNPYDSLMMPDFAGNVSKSFANGAAMRHAEDRNKLAMDEAKRDEAGRNALANIAGGMGGMNALMQFQARPANPQEAQPSPQAQAWRELARNAPDLFMQMQRLDADQRKALAEANERNLEIGGRAVSAIMGLAPEVRPQAYQQMRGQLEAQGFQGLPEQWDEQFAVGQMRLGMTVREALASDRADLRLQHDVEDDLADNERADENAESLDRYRQGQPANARRGQDVASRDRRRGQDKASADRRRGQDKPRGGRGKGSTAKAVLADGTPIVVRNGRWVNEKTGQPVE